MNVRQNIQEHFLETRSLSSSFSNKLPSSPPPIPLVLRTEPRPFEETANTSFITNVKLFF